MCVAAQRDYLADRVRAAWVDGRLPSAARARLCRKSELTCAGSEFARWLEVKSGKGAVVPLAVGLFHADSFSGGARGRRDLSSTSI